MEEWYTDPALENVGGPADLYELHLALVQAGLEDGLVQVACGPVKHRPLASNQQHRASRKYTGLVIHTEYL